MYVCMYIFIYQYSIKIEIESGILEHVDRYRRVLLKRREILARDLSRVHFGRSIDRKKFMLLSYWIDL